MNIIDQQTDKSQKFLYKALNGLKSDVFAGTVKKLAGEINDFSKVASESFAWPERRFFPMDTMENTVLSRVYFDAQKGLLSPKTADEIADRLDTFINLYDIPESGFDRITTKTAESTFDPRYLIPSLKLCKVANEQGLTDAGELFEKENSNLKIAQRVEFAHNFLKAAKDLKVKTIFPSVAKYAGTMDSNLMGTSHMLRLRSAAAKLAGEKSTEYDKIASSIEKVTDSPSRDELNKLAELIHEIDTKYGFDLRRYNDRIPCAYSIVFNKEAVDEGTDTKDDADTMTKGDIVARLGAEALDTLEDENGEIDRKKLKEFLSMQRAKTNE